MLETSRAQSRRELGLACHPAQYESIRDCFFYHMIPSFCRRDRPGSVPSSIATGTLSRGNQFTVICWMSL